MSKKNTPRLNSVQLARETLIRKMNYLRKIWSKLHLGRQNHFWEILCLQESWQDVSKSLVLLNTCLPNSPIGPRSAKLPNWQWTLDWWIDSFNVENNCVTSNMFISSKKFICHYQPLIWWWEFNHSRTEDGDSNMFDQFVHFEVLLFCFPFQINCKLSQKLQKV